MDNRIGCDQDDSDIIGINDDTVIEISDDDPSPKPKKMKSNSNSVTVNNSNNSNLKTKNMSEDENQRCVICISSPLQDPTILNGCSHFFCFSCIEQWLYTNPTCPMCKVPLEKLKHKLSPAPTKFPVDYQKTNGEELLIDKLLEEFELSLIKDAKAAPMNVEENAINTVIKDLRFKQEKQKYCVNEGLITKHDYGKYTREIHEMLQGYNLLLNKIRTNRSRREIYDAPEFRRTIYRCNLAPRSRLSPKFSINATPEYVANHEKEIRIKLLPYIIREYSSVLDRQVLDVDPILDRVIDYLKDPSRQARNQFICYLNELGVSHPSHFINNMIHFVSSGQKLNVYDEYTEYVNRGANDIRFYLGGDGGDVQILDEVRRPNEDSNAARRFRMMEHLMSLDRRDGNGSQSNSGDESSFSRIRSLDRFRRLDSIGDGYNSPPPSSSTAVVNIDDDDDNDGDDSPRTRRESRWNFLDYPLGFQNAYDFLRSRFPLRSGSSGEDVDNAFMDSFGSRMTRRNNFLRRSESPIVLDDSTSSTTNPNNVSITIDDDSDIEIVNGGTPRPKRPRISEL